MLKHYKKENKLYKTCKADDIQGKTNIDNILIQIEQNINHILNIEYKINKETSNINKAIFVLDLSNINLNLTNINLQNLKELLTRISEEINPTDPKSIIFKKIANKINLIDTQSNLFRNIINQYMLNCKDYKYSYNSYIFKEQVIKDLEKDKTLLIKWKEFTNEFNYSYYLKEADIKMFIFNITRILQKSKELIDLVKKTLESITNYIKSVIRKERYKERSYFQELKNTLKYLILKNSQVNIFCQIKRLNHQMFILLN